MYRLFGSPLAKARGLLNRNGVFYATVRMQGQGAPMEVALHGVRSEMDARQALEAFGAGCEIVLS